MGEHTPGPWRYREWGGLIVGGGTGSDEVLICTMATNTRHDEGRHNHALILAAPTMQARIAELEAELERVKRAAINGMNAATAHGHGLVEQAARLRAESNPDALESERAMNAALTEQLERAELARQDALAELAAAMADAERYRELRRLATTWPTTALVVNYNIGHDWRTADAPNEIDSVVDAAIAARGHA